MLRQLSAPTGGCLILPPNAPFGRPDTATMQAIPRGGSPGRAVASQNAASFKVKRPPPSSVMEWAARGSGSDDSSTEDPLDGSLTSMQWLQNLRLPMHGGEQAGGLAGPKQSRLDAGSDPDLDCDDDVDSEGEKRTLPSPLKDSAGANDMDCAVPDGSDEIDEIYRRHGHSSGYAKPPHSYASLITHAISTSSEKRMSLNEIYDWVIRNYPYYQHAGSGWKNSIRHNLSLNKCFVRVQRPDDDPRKGPYWTMNPNFQSVVEKASNKHLQTMQQTKKSPSKPQSQQQAIPPQPVPKQVSKVKRPVRQMSNPLVPTDDGGMRDPSAAVARRASDAGRVSAEPIKSVTLTGAHVPAVPGRPLHPVQMQALAAQLAAQQPAKPKRRQSKSLKQQKSVDSLQLSASSLNSSSGGSVTKPRRRGSQQRSSISSVRSSIDLSQLSLSGSGADIDTMSQSGNGDDAFSPESPNPMLFSDLVAGAHALPDGFSGADPRFAGGSARPDAFDPLDAVLGDCNMLLTSSWGPAGAPAIHGAHAAGAGTGAPAHAPSSSSGSVSSPSSVPLGQSQGEAFMHAFGGNDSRLSLSGSGAARFAAEFLADDGIIDVFDWTTVL